jgi:hypothetical protein
MPSDGPTSFYSRLWILLVGAVTVVYLSLIHHPQKTYTDIIYLTEYLDFLPHFPKNNGFSQHPQAGSILHDIVDLTNIRRQDQFYMKSWFSPTSACMIHFAVNCTFTNIRMQDTFYRNSWLLPTRAGRVDFLKSGPHEMDKFTCYSLSLTHFIYSYQTVLSAKIDHPSTTLCDLGATQQIQGFG